MLPKVEQTMRWSRFLAGLLSWVAIGKYQRMWFSDENARLTPEDEADADGVYKSRTYRRNRNAWTSEYSARRGLRMYVPCVHVRRAMTRRGRHGGRSVGDRKKKHTGGSCDRSVGR